MLPRNPKQVPQLFKEARALETGGRLGEAKRIYGEILRLSPRSAPARFQIAQIEYKLGQYEPAIATLEKALKAAPREQSIWGLYARALQKIGDDARTATFLARAKKARLDPKFMLSMQAALRPDLKQSSTSAGGANPQAIQAAIRELQAGNAAEALDRATALRRAHPGVAILADIAANALAALGRHEDAEAQFREAIALDPDYAESHANFGRFLVEQGQYDEAILQLRRALELSPRLHRAHLHLGQALMKRGQSGDAINSFRSVLEIVPDHAQAQLELGGALMWHQDLDEALKALGKARELGANPLDVGLNIAMVLWRRGEEQEALAEADKVLEIDPTCSAGYTAKASIYQSMAEFEKAGENFRKAIEHDPTNGENYRVYLLSNKLTPDDPLIAQMVAMFERRDLTDASRANFGFALAKAMEDTKQYNRVFGYLRPANELMLKIHPFNIDTQRKRMAAIRDQFRDADLQAQDVPRRSEFAPIFVTGLPRSGTTLVEQIIASHSTVEGGGELGYARHELRNALKTQSGHPRVWSDLNDDEVIAIGARVEAKMRAQVSVADKITDKAIESYTLIGAIRTALPNARIVVVKRDPRDNLLSIYKNLFVDGQHLYSYSLSDLAVMYRLFEEMVAYWRKKVPGWFHEIQYEDLIADPEAETRKLIAACDLEWEDACQSFHENKRRVDTLSVHQVRQPIYKSSMKAWQRYEDELGELFDALGGEYARTPAAE